MNETISKQHPAKEDAINPTIEERYWRVTYMSRPYVSEDHSYEEYGPAYQYGWEAFGRHVGRTFDEVEKELADGWDRVRRRSRLKWEQAREAVRDAWNRIAARHAKK